MDNVDRQILEILQRNGRLSNISLAEEIGLSPPSVLRRVKKLEEKKIIKEYVALVDREKIGKNLLVFISISIKTQSEEQRFALKIQEYPEVLECFHVTGETDYLLKVAVRHISELEDFIMKRISQIPGVDKVVTRVVLSEIKYQTALAINLVADNRQSSQLS